MSKKERLHWIDIAKGLMIIGMILNHIPNFTSKAGFEFNAPWWLIGHIYGVFTMQTFFLLSGYTSNFSIGFTPFFVKLCKGLLIPYFSFTILFKIIRMLFLGEGIFEEIGDESIFFLLEGFWFLSALFLAKLIIYGLVKASKDTLISVMGGAIVVTLIGFGINDYYSEMPIPSHWHNWFHYRNGLCMMIFMAIGYAIKKQNWSDNRYLWCGMVYIITYLITFVLQISDKEILYITPHSYSHWFDSNGVANTIFLIPSYLFYSIMGSFMVIWISKRISSFEILEKFGRQSLAIYCIHFTILQFVIIFFAQWIDTAGLITGSLYFIIVAIITIGLSLAVSSLFEKKPFNYLLGKF